MNLLKILPLLILATSVNAESTITFGTLLKEMHDMARLARLPDPAYRTIQLSSYDRRSSGPESPGWFSNADGFGREPIPNFAKILRQPDSKGVGLYLLADIEGPGAIVRGWSAGMGGTLRVFLDESSTPIWEGSAYDFFARRSRDYLERANLGLVPGDAFIQQDADYLPIPFAEHLRITWEGKVNELHFYHLQVRLYEQGTALRTFNLSQDLKENVTAMNATIEALISPACALPGDTVKLAKTLAPQEALTWSTEKQRSGALSELTLKLDAPSAEEALRAVRLRIAFDGCMRHQVEAPVGDFFGSGPGINPHSSLPFSVLPDGTMKCRFVMPYAKSASFELRNFSSNEVSIVGTVKVSPWTWDLRSMYFRAKWRADHDLIAGDGNIDIPYAVVIGQGVFAGCAAMIVNPSRIPTAWGNWWGEGDEKILIDGETVPSTFGTGSEDYFNYSWSRPDLFDHPYCGQPLDSGPDTAGYVSNHRYQMLDAIPFSRSLAVFLELWSHTRTPGLSYSRIAYHYARPDAIDDHRALMPSDLVVPELPERQPQASHGSGDATFHHLEDLERAATAGELELIPSNIATRRRVVAWQAEKGARLTIKLPIEKEGKPALHLVAVHRPDGATVRLALGKAPLITASGADTVVFQTDYVPRNLNVHFKPLDMKKGTHELILECIKSGWVGLDYIWVK